jgi:hypothetical protein
MGATRMIPNDLDERSGAEVGKHLLERRVFSLPPDSHEQR